MYQPYPGQTQMPAAQRPPAPAVLFVIATVDTFAGLSSPIAGTVRIWGSSSGWSG
jgi:hypothetical protein